MTRALVIPATSPAYTVALNADLRTLQNLVEGDIESVGREPGWHMYLNANGKYEGLPVNMVATGLLARVLMPGDLIVGTVVILGDTNDGGEGDVPERVVQEVAATRHVTRG